MRGPLVDCSLPPIIIMSLLSLSSIAAVLSSVPAVHPSVLVHPAQPALWAGRGADPDMRLLDLPCTASFSPAPIRTYSMRVSAHMHTDRQTDRQTDRHRHTHNT